MPEHSDAATEGNSKEAIYALSYQAFELAKLIGTGQGDKTSLAQKARELNDQLDKLRSAVEAAPEADQAGLNTAWSDARLDLDYVLSGGALPSSTRLFYYLEDLK